MITFACYLLRLPDMTRHSIKLTDPKTGGTVECILEFNEGEIKMLEAFARYVEELGQVEIVKKGVPCGLTVNITETGLSWTADIPDERDISHFLHQLRPLILKNEHASYEHVVGVLGKRGEHPSIRSFLKSQREIFDGRAMHKGLQITSYDGSDQAILNSEKVLFDWLNSYEYHRDQEKKEQVDRFHQILPVAASQPIFLMLLSQKVAAIMQVAGFIRVLLRKTETYTLHLQGVSAI